MNQSELKKKGRNFNCATCNPKVMKLRMCETDRWDYTEKDASFFPIKLSEGGTGYGFCPAKSTWDQDLIRQFRILLLSYETKKLLYSGGLADQPGWYIELLGWFVPMYDELKFYHRAKSILGDGKKKPGSQSGKGATSRGRNARRT